MRHEKDLQENEIGGAPVRGRGFRRPGPVQDLLYLAQVPDVIVDAGVCRAGLPQRVVPAAQDAGAASPLHVAGEGVAHDHHLVPAAGADLGEYRVKKGGPRLLGPHDLRDEDPVQHPVQAGAGQLPLLGDPGAVGHCVLPYPALQPGHQRTGVIPEHHSVPQAQLVLLVESGDVPAVQPLLGEKLLKAAQQDLGLGQLPRSSRRQ